MYLAFGTLTDYYVSVYCFATPLSSISLFRNIFTDNRHWSDSPVYSAQHQVLNAIFSKSWKPGENIAITVRNTRPRNSIRNKRCCMTLVSKQWICWARDYFLPHRNGTEAGILNLARSAIFILLHGGEKFECEHEHVVRAVSVTHNIAGHITQSEVCILYWPAAER